jgi:hypothetical protein
MRCQLAAALLFVVLVCSLPHAQPAVWHAAVGPIVASASHHVPSAAAAAALPASRSRRSVNMLNEQQFDDEPDHLDLINNQPADIDRFDNQLDLIDEQPAHLDLIDEQPTYLDRIDGEPAVDKEFQNVNTSNH